MKLQALTLSAILAASLAACNSKPQTAPQSDLTFEHLKSRVAYTLQGSASAFACDSDLTFGSSVDLLLPTAIYNHDITTLHDSILTLAFDTVGTDYPAIVSHYEKASVEQVGFKYNPIKVDTVAPFLANLDGYTQVQGNIANLTPRILSYQLILSEYPMHAAHGDYTIRYINYDMQQGRVIALEDLFTPEGIKALPKLLKDRARTVVSVIGPTAVTQIPAANNYFINNQGNLEFAYQPYEIASYAQGAVQLKIAPYLVTEYLTPYAKTLLLE